MKSAELSHQQSDFSAHNQVNFHRTDENKAQISGTVVSLPGEGIGGT